MTTTTTDREAFERQDREYEAVKARQERREAERRAARENLNDRIARVVREWDGWSPAERRKLDDVLAEVLDHCRTGNGNGFIAGWCRRVLLPALGVGRCVVVVATTGEGY